MKRAIRVTARIALGIYPRETRERYGDEIRELLASSRRPWRDLADLFRVGLLERLGALTPRHAWIASAVLILAVPAGALFLGLMMVAPLFAIVIAILSGRWIGQRLRSWWWLPTTATLALTVHAGTWSGADDWVGGATGRLPALSLFVLITPALAIAVAMLAARHPGVAASLGFLGGLALVNLVSIVFVLQTTTPDEVPRAGAWAWHLVNFLPQSSGKSVEVGDTYVMPPIALVLDLLEFFPSLVTVSLSFILACAYCGRKDHPDNWRRPPRLTDPHPDPAVAPRP